MTLREKIGKAIIRLRKQFGLSQEQFAYDSNVDRRYMSDLENGKRNVSIDVLERISKSLDIQASTLLSEAEQEGHSQDRLAFIKQWLCDNGYEDSILFENPDYAQAIVGVSEQGRVIYSYNKMVDSLRITDSISRDDAVEFIDYNTIRALPYMGDKAPIILYNIEN